MNWLIKRLYILAVLSLVLLLLSQTLGQVFWFFELFSHFVPHYAFVVFVAFVVIAFKESRNKDKPKTYFVVILMSIFIGLFAWCLTPIHHHQNLNNPITIAYHNININNPNFNTAYDKLSEHNPDLIILIEPNPDELKSVLDKHQHQILCEQLEYSPFSMAILSNNLNNNLSHDTLNNAHCELFDLYNFPVAKLKINNKTLFAIHPPPPINAFMANSRNEYLKQLAQLIQQEQGAVIVIGDMNTSAFSPVYREFVSSGQLNRTMANALPTWLPFGISIDQMLIKNSQANIKAMDWNNSDHRAFLVEWE